MPHLDKRARTETFRKYERVLRKDTPVRRPTSLEEIAALGIAVETVPVEKPSAETRDTAGHDEQAQTGSAAEPPTSDT